MRTRDALALTTFAVIGVSLISILMGGDGVKSAGEIQAEGDAWKAAHDESVAEHERTIDSIGR